MLAPNDRKSWGGPKDHLWAVFNMWFHMHFLRYAPPTRLLMDGHSSHYCPATIRSAAEEKVITNETKSNFVFKHSTSAAIEDALETSMPQVQCEKS